MRRSVKTTIIAILLTSTLAFGQQSRMVAHDIPSNNQPGTVTLSLTEYNHLIQLAEQERLKPRPAEPPLAYVLSAVSFKLTLNDQSVTGTLEITGQILQKGSVKVPLATGLTILEAQQSGNPLPLVDDGPTVSAILTGPGTFSVSLRVGSPITVEPGRASFALPAPSASTAVLNLGLAGSHANVWLDAGLITHRSTDNGRTQITATLEPGKTARVWWTTREVAAPVTQREVRFLADTKTVVTVGDSDLRMTALCDVTLVQGEPAEFRVNVPRGFDLAEVTGNTLDSSEVQSGVLVLRVRAGSGRAHQFLISVERASRENKLDVPFLAFVNAQRETGELLVEGIGTMELTATEGGGLHRIDVREAQPVARSLARFPLQAAFRYQNRQSDAPRLQLEWNEFPDSSVISAIAEQGTVTTLLNAEGKSLTEVSLRVRNHAQPFMKVDLPQGASLLSAEVDGEGVKPVQGSDGTRVPLLRAGLRPTGAYNVSFVYLNSGSALSKNGSYQMTLPKLDIPVSILTWEVSLPDRLQVRQFSGTAFASALVPPGTLDALYADDGVSADVISARQIANLPLSLSGISPGQIGGVVADANGAIVQGARVQVVNKQTGQTQKTRSDSEGRFLVAGMQPGPVEVTIDSPGFKKHEEELSLQSDQPARLGITLDVGTVTEAVIVTSGAEETDRDSTKLNEQVRKNKQADQAQALNPSANVFNLQRKVAGILPVRMEVPRAGRSYRFVRPLVLNEETNISFQYKLR